MANFDRFAVGLPDPQERPLTPIDSCKFCNTPIYLGYQAVYCDGYYFCDFLCFMRYMGAREVAAGTEG